MKRRKLTLHMADGGVLPRPVSPFSLRGMAGAAGGAMQGLRGGATNLIESTANTFGRPPGYTPAVVAPQPMVEAPPVAMPQVQLGGMNMGVQQRREAAAGLRDGTPFVHGPGGPTDDMVDAKLSAGESVLPADTTAAIGPENIQAAIDATHTPVKSKGLRHFANGIPGIEVTEEPFRASDAKLFGRTPPGIPTTPQPSVPGMRVEYPITDPGPGNPNVGRTPAPIADAAARAPMSTAGAGGLRGGMSALANGAGKFLRGGAAVAAPLAALQTYGTDTEDFAKRFGMQDTEPGLMRDMGLRALGYASDLGNAMSFGQASRLFRDKQGATDAVARPVTQSAQPATATSNPTDTRLEDGTQRMPASPRQTSFGNVTGDTAFENRGSISPQNDAAATNLSNRSAAQGAGLRSGFSEVNNLPAGYGTTIPKTQYETELEARNASVRSTLGDRDLSNRQLQARDTAERQDATARRGQDSAAQIAGMRDSTDRRGQDLTDAGYARHDQVSLRGQDITARGQDIGARTAGLKARQDQANSDRQYQLEVGRFGQDVADKNRAARSASTEEFTKNLQTRFRTTNEKGESTVDHDKVAQFSSAMSATLPRMIEQLEKSGKPEAVAKATQLRERGAAALEPGDLDGMQQLYDRRERMRAAKGAGPNQGSFSDSDNLLDFRQTGTEKRVLGGNRVVTPAGSVSVKDLQYSDGPANSFLPDWFKTEKRDLTRGLRME